MANNYGVHRCQLCPPNVNGHADSLPPAVVEVVGFGLCAHHAMLVCLIQIAGRPRSGSSRPQGSPRP